tara:strand:- start:739 stop:945 length:207 start_codon:yes stop_codon:yes gene_type:complete
MKTGDVVSFVSPPGLMSMDTTGWKQQSPGLIVGSRAAPVGSKPSYEVLWKNGERTFEWHSYLEVISKA